MRFESCGELIAKMREIKTSSRYLTDDHDSYLEHLRTSKVDIHNPKYSLS